VYRADKAGAEDGDVKNLVQSSMFKVGGRRSEVRGQRSEGNDGSM
jgi:hypothetical protein